MANGLQKRIAPIRRPTVSVVVECEGLRYRVIDNLRELVCGVADRCESEAIIGRKVLDLARTVDAKHD